MIMALPTCLKQYLQMKSGTCQRNISFMVFLCGTQQEHTDSQQWKIAVVIVKSLSLSSMCRQNDSNLCTNVSYSS